MPDIKDMLRRGLLRGEPSKVQQCLGSAELDINQEISLAEPNDIIFGRKLFTPLIWSFVNINQSPERKQVALAILNDPRCKIFSGTQDPLPYAIKMGVPPDLLDVLIEKGISEGADLESWLTKPASIRGGKEMEPLQQRTPFCIAAHCGNLGLVRYLIEERNVPITPYNIPSSNIINTTALVTIIERYNRLDNYGVGDLKGKLTEVMSYLIQAGVSLDDVELRDGVTKTLDAFVDEDEVWDHYKVVRRMLARAIAEKQAALRAVSPLSRFQPPPPPPPPSPTHEEGQQDQHEVDDSIEVGLGLS